MNTYLKEIALQLENIRRLLKVDEKEFALMTNIDLLELKMIEKEPQKMTRATAMRIFIIANARAKFEQSRSVRALLALCFQIDQMDTAKFVHKLNSTNAA